MKITLRFLFPPLSLSLSLDSNFLLPTAINQNSPFSLTIHSSSSSSLISQMQDIFASVRRSLVFRPPLDNDDSHSPAIGVGALVDKINSSIRKSRVFSRHSPSSSSLPPIPKDTDPPIRWRKGELIGCGAFGRVYMGMNLGSGELLAVKQVFQFYFSNLEFRLLFCWIFFSSFFFGFFSFRFWLLLMVLRRRKRRFGFLFPLVDLILIIWPFFFILEYWFSSLKLFNTIFLIG